MLVDLTMVAMRVGPVDFGEPRWLWALLTLIPVVWVWKNSRVAASSIRRAFMLALRCALIVMVVGALAQARFEWSSNGICIVFVLDQSQSVPGIARDNARLQIAAQVQKMRKEDRFCVVEFGADAVLDSLPSPKGPMPTPTKVTDAGQTDIGRSIRLALASFPPDRQKRVVLFTDGNENEGDALREARIAGANDVDIDVVMMTAHQGHEVMVDQVVLPPHVRKDANFVVRAMVTSDVAQSGRLLVTRDGSPMELPDDHVQLRAGTTVLDIPDTLADGGYHEYQVTVQPDTQEGDTFAANNTGFAFTQVDAPGRVLLVRGAPADNGPLYDALRATGVQVDATGVGGMPGSVKEFAKYDCVILDDVNGFTLTLPQMTELGRWVREFGGGLVLIGGQDSFGPGGYKNTPLEEVSPVEMDVKRQKHLASLAIVIVNDKSGSMGLPPKPGSSLEKMDLANAGSVEVMKLLDRTDYAMIGAVDTEVKWMGEARLLPMTSTNKNQISAQTLSVKAGGGGIYCKTALDHAYELINAPGVHAMAKHVIMFADVSDSQQQVDCVQMAADQFARNAVTTTVIGLGTKADQDAQFQQEVAKAGHGRWLVTDDAMALPRIFAKEAFLVSRSAYVEKKEGIKPVMYTSPLLEGFTETGVPPVYGYVGTTLKPRATMAMHGVEADDPLLAHWVIGLGKCVAYTSDSMPRWGRDWVSWGGYSKFWSQVVRWTSRSVQNNGLVTTATMEGADGRVQVDATDEAGKPLNNLQLKATVIQPDATTHSKEVTLEQVAPGKYQAKFPASQRGTYLVTVSDAQSNEPLSTGGGVMSYPAEYRDLQPNPTLLHAVADATNGSYRSNLENVFAPKKTEVMTFWPLAEGLLAIVATAFLGDVAWRRLNVADWFTGRTPSRAAVARSGSSVGAFRSVKSARQEREAVQPRQKREREEPLTSPARSAPLDPVDTAFPVTPAAPAAGTTPSAEEPAGGGYSSRLMQAKKRAADQMREQQ